MLNRIIDLTIILGLVMAAFVVGMIVMLASTAANAAPSQWPAVAVIYPTQCSPANPRGESVIVVRPICTQPFDHDAFGCTEDQAV